MQFSQDFQKSGNLDCPYLHGSGGTVQQSTTLIGHLQDPLGWADKTTGGGDENSKVVLKTKYGEGKKEGKKEKKKEEGCVHNP